MMKNYQPATLEEYGYRDYKILKKIFHYFVNILVVLIIIMMFLPIIIIAIQSVNDTQDLSVFNKFSFNAYINMFTDDSFSTVVKNTLLVTFIATLLATILGTFIAVGINSLDQKHRQRLILLNNIPLLNADIVTGISLMLVFSLLLPIFPYI
ncbi:MAG: hypothetical protein GX661_03600, partial [Acholeplasmataceae bacterium]|nr:hypothetical protein [Acholeplasmataceae bacterium]